MNPAAVNKGTDGVASTRWVVDDVDFDGEASLVEELNHDKGRMDNPFVVAYMVGVYKVDTGDQDPLVDE